MPGRRPAWSPAACDSLLLEVDAVLLDEGGPLLRHAVVREDRLDRARRLAGLAVDALVGVDVELILPLVDAIDGTDLDAGLVLHPDAGLGDHERHAILPRTSAQRAARAFERGSLGAGRPKRKTRGRYDPAGGGFW